VISAVAHSVLEHGPALNVAARMVLAATDPTTDDDSDDESKKSGPIGIVVIIVLCVACYFLFKSLSKHLRRVREHEVPVSALPVRPAAGDEVAESADATADAEPVSVPDARSAAAPDQEPAPPPAP
jgi:hypothetical protein